MIELKQWHIWTVVITLIIIITLNIIFVYLPVAKIENDVQNTSTVLDNGVSKILKKVSKVEKKIDNGIDTAKKDLTEVGKFIISEIEKGAKGIEDVICSVCDDPNFSAFINLPSTSICQKCPPITILPPSPTNEVSLAPN